MPEDPIPENARKFLAEYVRSIAQLEILLLLNAPPQRSWSVTEVYQTLLSNELLVEGSLGWFCERGLVTKNDSNWRFAASEEQSKIVTRLAELYRERPARIVQAIYEPKLSEIEEFAKAFKLRKDK